MQTIKIPEKLNIYLNKLYYEYIRYQNICTVIKKDFTNMTDEEWESSFYYYYNLYEEAKLKWNIAYNFLLEKYNIDSAEEIRINFLKQQIEDKKLKNYISTGEPFSSFIPTIYERSINIKDITFQVTEDCNMACTYCYQHSKKKNSIMNFSTAKIFIDQLLSKDKKIKEYCELDCVEGCTFNFFGGEPLLEIELMDQITKYLLGEMFRLKHPWLLKSMFSCSSNGLLYFNKKVQHFLKTYKNFFDYGITVDGYKSLHDKCRLDLNGQGTYDRVISAAKDYANKRGELGSKMTFSPDNIHYTYLALKEMVEFGHNTINANCVFEEGWTIQHAKIFYQQLKLFIDYLKKQNLLTEINCSLFSKDSLGEKLSETNTENSCGGTGKMVALDPKGNFYPCFRYVETSQNPNNLYIIGNVNEGIGQTPETKEKIKNLLKITRQSQSSQECLNCPINGGCGWCNAYNHEYYGTPNKRTTFICEMHKARVLANYYYLFQLNKSYKMHCPIEWAIPIIGIRDYNLLLNNSYPC